MRFKQWLSENGLATTAMHGGIGGGATNDNMPYGVQSKYATKNASPDKQIDTEADKVPPEVTFGFRSRSDKRNSQERRGKTIDSLKKGAPLRDNRPDIIY